jgi:hypothetical protein
MSNEMDKPREIKTPGDYEVGWGKPPEKYQFKKGAPSPNPGGRPLRTRVADDDRSIHTSAALREALNQKIRLTEHGKTRNITARKAISKRTVNKMLKTDNEAILIRFLIFLEKMESAACEDVSREPLHITITGGLSDPEDS